MSERIIVKEINKSYVRIEAPKYILLELSELFQFKASDSQFHPLVKKGLWDGTIRLFKSKDQSLPYGLIEDVFEKYPKVQFLVDDGIIDHQEYTKEYLIEFMKGLGLPPEMEFRDYQLDYILAAINNVRTVLISPTSSGKSFILYIIVRFLFDHKIIKKGLIIVPRIQLVKQLFSDFVSYGWTDAEKHCNLLYGGREKTNEGDFLISTWQSLLYEKKGMDRDEKEYIKSFYEEFDFLCIDEAHEASQKGADVKKLKEIADNCVNAGYRTATTGSLEEISNNVLTLKGIFGRLIRIKTTRDLIDEGYSPDLSIKVFHLKYPKDEVKYLKKIMEDAYQKEKKLGTKKLPTVRYNKEIEFIVNHEKRNKLIAKLALTRKENCLVTFKFVSTEKKPHGRLLYEQICKLNKDKDRKIFFVTGKTDVDVREEIRAIVEKESNAIIVASEKVFSMGINIKRLNNLIIAGGGKSFNTIVQSIGRILRKYKDIDVCLYDIGDDLPFSKEHLLDRLRIYKTEEHKYEVIEWKL